VSASFSLPRGSVGVLTGPTAARRLLGAAVAGRITPESGHLQVLGASLPSEAGSVARRVTLVDLDSRRPDVSTAVGDAIGERLRLARPWFRRVPRGSAEVLVSRINASLATVEGESPIDIHRTLGELSPLALSLLFVALGVADGAELLVVDAGDGDFAHPASPAFAGAVAGIADPGTAVLLGLEEEPALHAATVGDRPLVRIDLTFSAGSSASPDSPTPGDSPVPTGSSVSSDPKGTVR
jgi:RND superfamily putative drug exporter